MVESSKDTNVDNIERTKISENIKQKLTSPFIQQPYWEDEDLFPITKDILKGIT
jgi:hypothetical protein